MREFKLKSFDGEKIHCRLWDDVSDAKGVVQILHGMSEYAGRYDEFARYLNSRGYIVFADDHRAHGLTETDENRGKHKGNIFKKTLQDELYFREWLKDEYDLPVFLLGHSYGSFLSQAFIQQDTDVKAVALIGSGYMRGLFTLGKIAVAPIFLVARNWRPKLVNKVGNTFIRYKGDSGQFQWGNSVKERREELLSDQYAHIDMSVGFDFYMMRETSRLYGRKARANLNPTTAVALFSGDEDPVGQYGRSVKRLERFYRDNGVTVETHLYEGARHEVFYDYCGKDVQKDVADFFDKFIIYKQTSIDDLV